MLEKSIDPSVKKRYLKSLMKICKVYRLVPTSFRILDTQLEKLEEEPCNQQPDVLAGTYTKEGQDPEFVSIKILSRVEADRDEVMKVGAIFIVV